MHKVYIIYSFTELLGEVDPEIEEASTSEHEEEQVNVPAPLELPIELKRFQPGETVPLNVTSKWPCELCPELSIVQFANFKRVCWTNACIVAQRYAFQRTGNFAPIYDVNSEEFPVLKQDSFEDFVIHLAGLRGNYVVTSSERLIKSYLDQFFSERQAHDGVTLKENLYREDNEPEDYLGKKH